LKMRFRFMKRLRFLVLLGKLKFMKKTFFTQVIRRRELDFIKQVIKAEKPRLVLDYGCGGGWLSRLMCKWGFEVVGIDLSKRLVRVAKSVCREGDFVVCDAMRLPFRNCSFDFIIGISILHHLPKLSMALSELEGVRFSNYLPVYGAKCA
jgi:2-polyprenyl-3-methyl-5-hydroxy-6-metoxy-1,4-benzoquinol methylase